MITPTSRSLAALVVAIVWEPALAQNVGQWGEEQLLKPASAPSNRASQATHAILLHTGKVLCVDQTNLEFSNPGPDRLDCVLLDPATGVVQTVYDNVAGGHWRFCSGHSKLVNGWVVFVGGGSVCCGNPILGHRVEDRISIYKPDANGGIGEFVESLGDPPVVMKERWCAVPTNCPGSEIDTKRYYPTCTTIGENRILITDGACSESTTCPDFGRPFVPVLLDVNLTTNALTFTPFRNAEYDTTSNNFTLGQYPHMYLMSSGKVAKANSNNEVGPNAQMRRLNTTTGLWNGGVFTTARRHAAGPADAELRTLPEPTQRPDVVAADRRIRTLAHSCRSCEPSPESAITPLRASTV